MVAGAAHVPRGILEFRADPESATHDKAFARDKTIILYCGSGGRAALAGKEHVRRRFLTPRLLRDWLVHFNELEGTGADSAELADALRAA